MRLVGEWHLESTVGAGVLISAGASLFSVLSLGGQSQGICVCVFSEAHACTCILLHLSLSLCMCVLQTMDCILIPVSGLSLRDSFSLSLYVHLSPKGGNLSLIILNNFV